MRKLNPIIKEHRELADQIRTAVHGDVVDVIRKRFTFNVAELQARSIREGDCLKVEPKLMNDIYELCHEVMERLGFKEDVDFYIISDANVNANSIYSESDKPHMIQFSSGLINLLDDDELKFVVGHELGHLINHDRDMDELMHFVFPEEGSMPVHLQKRFSLYQQLAELSADRFGYEACQNINACVSVFYKMTSGMDLQSRGVNIFTMIAKNKARYDFFRKEACMTHISHPMSAIRVQAIVYYTTDETEELHDSHVQELIELLSEFDRSECNRQMSLFMASAGFKAAGIDGTVDKEERSTILRCLAEQMLLPERFLEEIATGNVDTTLDQTVKYLSTESSDERLKAIRFLADVILSDHLIAKEEMDFIMDIGHRLNFTDAEIYMVLTEQIRQHLKADM